MASEREIMHLEAAMIQNNGLTPDQWVKFYAEAFRRRIYDVIKKKGKLPTVEEMERELYC